MYKAVSKLLERELEICQKLRGLVALARVHAGKVIASLIYETLW